jgi:hypothetical protein
MGQVRALAAAATLCAVVCAGCSVTVSGGPAAAVSSTRSGKPAAVTSPVPCDQGGTLALTRPRKPGKAWLWPERLVAPEDLTEAIQAIDFRTGLAYTLASTKIKLLNGPFALECISLRTGAVHRGPVFPASPPPEVHGLAVASGYLWVWRTASQPVISQVDPRDLVVIRTLRLPRVAGPCYLGTSVAPGPGGSVWIGSADTLLRVAAATGAVVTRVTLPAGGAVSDIAVDPARRHLYVSVTDVVRGGCQRNAVLEYGAQDGQELAAATSGLITDSVIGASLTAVPGGVWASFRTGMLGLTIHLRQRDLAMITPSSPRVALRAANGLFHWAMTSATSYAGGSLWISTLDLLACLNPRTGKTRAIERIPQSPGALKPLAADPSSRHLYALGPDGLMQITPPHQCWR